MPNYGFGASSTELTISQEQRDALLQQIVPVLKELPPTMEEIMVMYAAGSTDEEISRSIKPRIGDETIIHVRIVRFVGDLHLPFKHHTKENRSLVHEAFMLALPGSANPKSRENKILEAADRVEKLSAGDVAHLKNVGGTTHLRLRAIASQLGLDSIPDGELKYVLNEVCDLCFPKGSLSAAPIPTATAVQASAKTAKKVAKSPADTETKTVTSVPQAFVEPVVEALPEPVEEPAPVIFATEEQNEPELVSELQASAAHQSDSFQQPDGTLKEGETMYASKIAPLIGKLSDSERDVLECMAEGDADGQIADTLKIDVSKVVSIKAKLFKKLNLPDSLDSGDEKNYRARVSIEAYRIHKPPKVQTTPDIRPEAETLSEPEIVETLELEPASEAVTVGDAEDLVEVSTSTEILEPVVEVVQEETPAAPATESVNESPKIADQLPPADPEAKTIAKRVPEKRKATARAKTKKALSTKKNEKTSAYSSDDVATVGQLIRGLIEQKKLTSTEILVLGYISKGLTNSAIAEKEDTAVNTAAHRIYDLGRKIVIPRSDAKARRGSGERKLMGAAYQYYLAHLAGDSTAPSVEPPAPTEPLLASGVAAVEPSAPPVVQEAEPIASSSDDAGDKSAPLAETEADASIVEPSAPVESMVETVEGPDATLSDAATADEDTAETVAPTTVSEPEVTAPEPRPEIEETLSPAAIGMAAATEIPVIVNFKLTEPGTVEDVKVLDSRSPNFEHEKHNCIVLDKWRIEEVQAVMQGTDLFTLILLTKRRF